MAFGLTSWGSQGKTQAKANNNNTRSPVQVQVPSLDFEDVVHSVSEDGVGNVKIVTFRRHAAIYSLNPQADRYIEMLAALKESKSTEKSVRVVVNPNTLAILEVSLIMR